jgi:quercetin dioxygenase-like cupin family protein/DNA-binding XRE family transcriptional regulator
LSNRKTGGCDVLSETLSEGLARYGIGEKLRRLRLKKKMGLVELGRHTGLSPAMLSKIERGRLYPTLPTLLRIALVFSVGLEFFFAGPRERPTVAVVRKQDRLRFPEHADGPSAYAFECLDYPATERQLNAYYVEITARQGDETAPHAHPGAEVIYVLRGRLALRVEDDEHVLEAGDSVYFDAGAPHAYSRSGGSPCAAVVVTTP